MDEIEEILASIDRALARKGLSDAAASKRAAGNTALIKNLRLSRATSPEDRRTNFHALRKLADVLDLECYFGPRRETGMVLTAEVAGEDYVAVPRYDAQFSAGHGADNGHVQEMGCIAFRRDWIERESLSAGQAMVVNVKGDSMAPTLSDGDLVLIDKRKKTPVNRRIYALIGPDGEARVKRVERLPGNLLLHSDNEAYPTEIIPASEAERVNILGEVVWWGHTVKE